MEWKKTPWGWVSADGRWNVRFAPVSAGRWFWLYEHGRRADGTIYPIGRYSPTGKYADAVGFATGAEARAFAANLGGF